MSQSKNKIGRGPSYCHLQAFCSFLFWQYGLFLSTEHGGYTTGITITDGCLTLSLSWFSSTRGDAYSLASTYKLSHTWLNVGKWVLNIVSVAVIIVSFGIVFYVVVPAYSLLSSTEPILLVEPAQVFTAYPICMCIFVRKRQQL